MQAAGKMVTYVFMLAGAVLGYAFAWVFLGPNDTGTALGGRLVLALAGALIGWWGASITGGRAPIVWSSDVTRITSGKHFDDLLAGSKEKSVLVSFYADWCLPCRLSARRMNALAKEGHAVAVVNIDQQTRLAQRFDIIGVPTLFLLRGGEVAVRITGMVSAEDLRALLAGR